MVCLNEHMLLPLCMLMTMHIRMFYVLNFLFQHYMPVHVHGAIFLEVFDGLVASSSSVRGLGTLQVHQCVVDK